jgi:hypothetical protein
MQILYMESRLHLNYGLHAEIRNTYDSDKYVLSQIFCVHVLYVKQVDSCTHLEQYIIFRMFLHFDREH